MCAFSVQEALFWRGNVGKECEQISRSYDSYGANKEEDEMDMEHFIDGRFGFRKCRSSFKMNLYISCVMQPQMVLTDKMVMVVVAHRIPMAAWMVKRSSTIPQLASRERS